MNAFDLIDIAFTALEQRKDFPRGAATAGKSHVMNAQPEASPHADLGTAEVGVLRYFTVRVERNGRTIYEHVQAPHTWAASKAALDANPSACCAQVVREIDRAEYERLARHR